MSDDPKSPQFEPEADTRPDRGTICPHCDGEGERLSQTCEGGTWLRRLCPVCRGRKKLTAEELLEYRKRQDESDEG